MTKRQKMKERMREVNRIAKLFRKDYGASRAMQIGWKMIKEKEAVKQKQAQQRHIDDLIKSFDEQVNDTFFQKFNPVLHFHFKEMKQHLEEKRQREFV
ncbi:MAG: hypothetical protein AAF228_03520 [Pseudomonadota bacterium]